MSMASRVLDTERVFLNRSELTGKKQCFVSHAQENQRAKRREVLVTLLNGELRFSKVTETVTVLPAVAVEKLGIDKASRNSYR